VKCSIIISTYNSPEWLQKVLWGFENQTYRDFELVIADDGSGDSTRQVVDGFRKRTGMNVIHIWHADNGFQKSAILNKAIAASTTGYLIFTDGDCIPRKDFVETHMRFAESGRFLSGGYFMLPLETSTKITESDIRSGRAFDLPWLRVNGLPATFKSLKLTAMGWKQTFLNFITTTRPTWNGHNASGWKKDILAVNGFNEEMKYGGQDRELGERMENYGIRGKQIRYSAICIHLDHKRGYKTEESIRFNKAVRAKTRSQKLKWTEFGIVKSES
jgi:glycosyltransferase involved in cell wall biosynthesis